MKNLTLLLLILFTTTTIYAQVHVDFTADKTVIMAGPYNCVQFTDLSVGNPTSWFWSIPGADISTSVEQNPSFCFSNCGQYQVSLTAAGGNSSDTETISDYITVIPHSKLSSPQCNSNVNLTGSFYLDAAISGSESAEDYRLTIINQYPDPHYYNTQTTGGATSITKSSFEGLEYNRTYRCSVNVKINGVWNSAGGPWCTFYTTPNTWLKESRSSNPDREQITMNIFPNPSHHDGFQIDLTGLKEESNQVSISMYDMFGKQVYTKEISRDQSDFTTRINSNGELSTGIYLVNILVNDQPFNQKVQVK